MKCPRRKFACVDYSKDLEEQQKAICKGCPDFLAEKEWGNHCNASLICLVTGKKLGAEAFEKLPKDKRENATHTLSDEGRKTFIQNLEALKKQRKYPLW